MTTTRTHGAARSWQHAGSVAFVVTSNGGDAYSAMTRIAVASIRITNPGIAVEVHCDCETDLACRRAADPLIDEVDRWVPHATPEGAPTFRNRFIKTRLRQVVNGPLLFLDSDLLVREDIGHLFEIDADVAGAANHSGHTVALQIWEQDAAEIERMGWQVSPSLYINGGVLLYQDTPGARRLGAEWHRRWLEAFQRGGRYRDQPALNSALHSSQVRLARLPDRFNAQFTMNPAATRNAAIWHYYASVDGARATTGFEQLVKATRGGGALDKTAVEALVRQPHPWLRQGPLANWMAHSAVGRGRLRGWERAYLTCDIPRYITGLGGRIRERLAALGR